MGYFDSLKYFPFSATAVVKKGLQLGLFEKP